jgi:two-component system sensor histidine kinase RpfC
VRILVAEDNDIAAKVITTLLAKQGAEVSLTTDGQQALELALSDDHHFDLAFIDLRMPGLDGIGFTEALRDAEGDGQRLPVVALTANAAEDVKKRCLDAGMDAFLTKPVEPTSLAEMVRRYSRDASPS